MLESGDTRLVVVVLEDGMPPVRHAFQPPLVRAGRGRENELLLVDGSLSRSHLELAWSRGTWTVHDLGSRNGSYLNGKRLKSAQHLANRDEIRLGRFTLFIELKPPILAGAGLDAETCGSVASEASGNEAGSAHLVGDGPALRALRSRIQKFAASSLPVLIRGEAGTGKELVARLLHEWSPRAEGPFVVINCPAIPENLFAAELFGVARNVATGVDARRGRLELADGGTVFFDEVADLAPACQAMLLRFTQERTLDVLGGRDSGRRLDVRIVAATNADIEESVQVGRFRADLHDRLAGAVLLVPPLREHAEDIADLVQHFLARASPRVAGISPEALAELEGRSHPANVRGLASAVGQAAALAAPGRIEVSHLPPPHGGTAHGMGAAAALRVRLSAPEADFERDLRQPYLKREFDRGTVRDVVAELIGDAGSKTELARRLSMSPKRLMDFLRDNRLRPEDS